MPKKKKKKAQNINSAVWVVGLIVVSILLAILIYSESGYIGKALSPILGGLMGFIKYILPIGIFAVAISIACNKKDYVVTKLIEYGVLLLCISVILCVWQINAGNLNVTGSFTEGVDSAYTLGERNIGGGAIGAIVAIALYKLIGAMGTLILSAGVAIVLLIFILEIDVNSWIANKVDEIKEEHKKDKTKQKEIKIKPEEEILDD